MNIKKLCRTALLLALALILNYIEHSLPPLPLLPPGVTLGFANIIIMYCLIAESEGQAAAIALLKSIFVLLTRGMIAFILSFSGTMLSFVVIFLLLKIKKPRLSYIMLSICGSLVHSLSQLAVSSVMLYTTAALFYIPILIITSVITGAVNGLLLKLLIPPLLRLKNSTAFK